MQPNPEFKVPTTDANSWSAAIRSYIAQADEPIVALYESTVIGRSACNLLLELRSDMRVLVLGCGTGLLSHTIAPLVREVIGVDFSSAPLSFARQRCERLNTDDKVSLILTKNSGPLPLRDRCFDGVIVGSHVIDKANCSDRLKEAWRVVKPNGWIFVNVDNRSDTRPALPRRQTFISRIANVIGLVKKALGFSPDFLATHNATRSLSNVGMQYHQLFGLLGNDAFISRITPLQKLPHWNRYQPASIKQRLINSKHLSSRYAVLAKNNQTEYPSGIKGILKDIHTRLPSEYHCGQLIIKDFQISRKDKIVMVLQGPSYLIIARVPLGSSALNSDKQNAAMLDALATKDLGTVSVPKLIIHGEAAEHEYFVESMLPGKSLAFCLQENEPTSMFDDVNHLLDMLNPSFSTKSYRALKDDLYDDIVTKRVSRLGVVLTDQASLRRLSDYFRANLYGIEMPFGLQHGDFSASNIIVRDRTIRGLIDWESGTEAGLPIIDAINYVESLRRLFTGQKVDITIPQLASGTFISKAEKQFIFNRYAKCGIDAQHHQALVYLKWLIHMDYLLNFWLQYDSAGVEKLIRPVIADILEKR